MRIKYRRGKPPKFYYPDGQRFISKYERRLIIHKTAQDLGRKMLIAHRLPGKTTNLKALQSIFLAAVRKDHPTELKGMTSEDMRKTIDDYIKDLESSKSLYTGINVVMKQDNPLDPQSLSIDVTYPKT